MRGDSSTRGYKHPVIHDSPPPHDHATLAASTGEELCALDRAWGPLFNRHRPTARMDQLLRGVAHHLAELYETRPGLVLPTAKVQLYYRAMPVTSDVYAWVDVFDDRLSNVSRMLSELQVEHHLVQTQIFRRPDAPALTPGGFAAWSTLLIQAYPDQEFERLNRVLRFMPICNPDNVRERFPKELSRQLLPRFGCLRCRDLLRTSVAMHGWTGSASDRNWSDQTRWKSPSTPATRFHAERRWSRTTHRVPETSVMDHRFQEKEGKGTTGRSHVRFTSPR